MHIVRARLPWIVGAWLLCQSAAFASAPLALWRSPAASAADDDCCPGVAPGQVCPMHHAKEGARTCAMRSACAPSDAALVALSGGIGVPSRAPVAIADTLAVRSIQASDVITSSRASRPESPPPRA
jgi:hypothetical protein